MKTLKFETRIDSPAEKVWHALWNDKNYREWASAFAEGSCAESDWKEGSSVHFLDASGEGMFSKIKTMEANKKMVFEHLGAIKDGKKATSDWAGSIEEYVLEEHNGKTKLSVCVDVTEKYQDYFEKTFPQALQKVKEISEK